VSTRRILNVIFTLLIHTFASIAGVQLRETVSLIKRISAGETGWSAFEEHLRTLGKDQAYDLHCSDATR
jgi:hypothetical protein